MNLEQAEDYVEKTWNAWWDGWTVRIFKPNDKARYSKYGMQQNGKWGYVRTVEPDEKGMYDI